MIGLDQVDSVILNAKVSDFIINGSQSIPDVLALKYPELIREIQHIHIPAVDSKDVLVWSLSDSGCLSFKKAYIFFQPVNHYAAWSKVFWNVNIPQSHFLSLQNYP